jgi:hypothetical protein
MDSTTIVPTQQRVACKEAAATQITCKYKHYMDNYKHSYNNTHNVHAVAPNSALQNFNGYILVNFYGTFIYLY